MPYRIPVIMLLCYYIIMLLPACSSYTCAHLLYLYASLIPAHISLYLRSSLNISIALVDVRAGDRGHDHAADSGAVDAADLFQREGEACLLYTSRCV